MGVYTSNNHAYYTLLFLSTGITHLAKGYEDQKMVSFINGILGSFVKKELPDEGDRS